MCPHEDAVGPEEDDGEDEGGLKVGGTPGGHLEHDPEVAGDEEDDDGEKSPYSEQSPQEAEGCAEGVLELVVDPREPPRCHPQRMGS